MTYTLSIEDRVGTGANVTERTVLAKGIGGYVPFTCEASYNPNKDTGAFKENGPYDTSFSIVHPFREVANLLALHHLANGGVEVPQVKYVGVNEEAQRKLFENILSQEFYKNRDQPITPQKRAYGALPPPGREHEIGMTATEILAKRRE